MKKLAKKPKHKVLQRKVNRRALAKRCESQFNLYIRLRDCKAYSGGFDRGCCVTCGREYPFASLQAGHFVHDKTNVTHAQYDERNVRAQCVGCNKWGNGMPDNYALYLINRHGVGIIEELHNLKYKSYTNDELQEILVKYKKKVENILYDNS